MQGPQNWIISATQTTVSVVAEGAYTRGRVHKQKKDLLHMLGAKGLEP
jgi:hypothetical protein